MLNCGHKLRTLPQCKQIPVSWIGFTFFFKSKSQKSLCIQSTSLPQVHLIFDETICKVKRGQSPNVRPILGIL